MVKSQRGVGLIEVLVALAILGIIAVAFLTGLATTAKAVLVADIRTGAESLARSQMEDIKNQPYDDILPIEYTKIPIHPDLSGFSIDDIEAVRLDPEGDGFDDDDGMQKITLIIKYNNKQVITLEGYKVDR